MRVCCLVAAVYTWHERRGRIHREIERRAGADEALVPAAAGLRPHPAPLPAQPPPKHHAVLRAVGGVCRLAPCHLPTERPYQLSRPRSITPCSAPPSAFDASLRAASTASAAPGAIAHRAPGAPRPLATAGKREPRVGASPPPARPRTRARSRAPPRACSRPRTRPRRRANPASLNPHSRCVPLVAAPHAGASVSDSPRPEAPGSMRTVPAAPHSS